MNNEQYKRFRKMEKDPLNCLFKAKDKAGNLHFLISGSTGVKYKVSIYLHGEKKGKINCTCPDFKNNAKIQECVCKHCLHVLYKVLKIFKNVDHSFFGKCLFTVDEMTKIRLLIKA